MHTRTAIEKNTGKIRKASVNQPPTVMSNGSDPALLGKIRIVVEAIFEIWDTKKRCITRKGKYNTDNNGSVL